MAHRSPATQTGLARLAGLVAVVALVRAVALTTGYFDPGSVITGRLPFQSPALCGVALALVVATPMATAGLLARGGHRRAGEVAMLAGVLLLGWIGVQLMVIRTFTWIQPVMVVVGLAMFTAGWQAHGGVSKGWFGGRAMTPFSLGSNAIVKPTHHHPPRGSRRE